MVFRTCCLNIPFEGNNFLSVGQSQTIDLLDLLELKWLPIRKQLYLRKAILVFKCMNEMAPGYLADRFVKRFSISGRQTRSSQLLDIPPLKTTAGQRSFYYQAVKLRDDPSDRLKFCKNVNTFKFVLRRKLLNEFLNN